MPDSAVARRPATLEVLARIFIRAVTHIGPFGPPHFHEPFSTVTEPRESYLLPCACGRDLVIQPRQAGEMIRCECGRECAVPRLNEIRRLRSVEKSVPKVQR